jgi:hypothetical protein
LRVLTRSGVALFRTKVFVITINVLVAVVTVLMLVAIMSNTHRPQLLEISVISIFFYAWTVRRTVIRVVPHFVFMISTSSH